MDAKFDPKGPSDPLARHSQGLVTELHIACTPAISPHCSFKELSPTPAIAYLISLWVPQSPL